MAPRKTTIKKQAPKRARKKVEEEDILEESFETSFDDDLEFEEKSSKKKFLIILLILIAVVALAYNFRSLFIAAMVNSKPVTRLNLIQELEKRQGKDVLESLITENLINQEAANLKIQISQDEINQEVAKIEENIKSQGQTLDQILTTQGMTRADLEKQIRFQKIIEKALEKDIAVSDQEITDYIKADKTTYPKGTATDEQKQQISEQLRQQKLSEKFQTWLDEIRNKAKINYFLY